MADLRFLPPAVKGWAFIYRVEFLGVNEDRRPTGFRNKLFAHTVCKYIDIDQYHHRHSHAMSMKHLSSNNREQGV